MSATLAAFPLPAPQVGFPCSAGHRRGPPVPLPPPVPPLHPRPASVGGETWVEGDEGGSWPLSWAATQGLGLVWCLVGKRERGGGNSKNKGIGGEKKIGKGMGYVVLKDRPRVLWKMLFFSARCDPRCVFLSLN